MLKFIIKIIPITAMEQFQLISGFFTNSTLESIHLYEFRKV